MERQSTFRLSFRRYFRLQYHSSGNPGKGCIRCILEERNEGKGSGDYDLFLTRFPEMIGISSEGESAARMRAIRERNPKEMC